MQLGLTVNNSPNKIPSVMNLGSQPTIDPLLPSAVEVHLINKDINLYGLNLSVEPIEKLRSQIKFQNIESTYLIKLKKIEKML